MSPIRHRSSRARAASGKAVLAAALLCAGCHNTPAADAHERTAASAGPHALPASGGSASAGSGADAGAPLPPYLPDGCWGDVALDGGAEPLLQDIARRCAQGMQPFAGKSLIAVLSKGKRAKLSFSLDDADKCVRVVAAGGPGVRDLALSLEDEKGHVYGRDALQGPFALVDDGGPVCLPAKGTYRAVVRVREGSGRVALRVYRAR